MASAARSLPDGVDVRGPMRERFDEVLTPAALAFVAGLQREFDAQRETLLASRAVRQAELQSGTLPDFLPQTRHVREGIWTVAPTPPALQKRWVEITGPVERKMMINALNSGASAFMADFEDSLSPTWQNVIDGQVNLIDAVARTIVYTSPVGKPYRLAEQIATLLVRPRGWHLVERHVLVDGRPVSASLFDFGLFVFHNGRRLAASGAGPYLYLPKLESHQEARQWNQVFQAAQDSLGILRGTIKATVLIETVLAAFEMDEILYELRDHAAGLNAGRWDYIFSLIKKFRTRPDFVLPDRAQVTMTVPFMRAYTRLLVHTCHRRRAHAIGGMAAFVPNRRDPQVNEVALARVRDDKVREASDGFDGTWVAHPDLVPVAADVFTRVMGDRPNQLERRHDDERVGAADLIDIRVPDGSVTDAGLRNNVSVALQYLESWLRGVGAVTIFNLMEDTATAEIARSQVWQWVYHGARVQDGPTVTPDLVRRIEQEEREKIRATVGDEAYRASRYDDASDLFEQVALDDRFVEFLTFPALARID